MSPQSSLSSLGAVALLLLTGAFAQSPAIITDNPFQKAMPVPKAITPKFNNIVNPVTKQNIHYYEVEIKNFTTKAHETLSEYEAIGYQGTFPGPTFLIQKGTETVVRYTNTRSTDTSAWQLGHAVHLHGSPSRAAFDGWADDLVNVTQSKDYYYPNSVSARMLWYHDHSDHRTADNVNAGLAGLHIINDPAEDKLNLPKGYGEFDVPIVIRDVSYDEKGVLVPASNTGGFGDVIDVNGQAWPFFGVQPRKYRLRFLNAGIARAWNLSFEDATKKPIEFQMIASDAGLFNKPVKASNFGISPAERYEVVVDFAPFKGTSVTLRNSQDIGDPADKLANIMRFDVSPNAVEDPSTVPETLGAELPAVHPGVKTQRFDFGNNAINNIRWEDTANRVLTKVPRGTIEQWILASDGDNHPIHTHLIDFRIVKREGGRGAVEAYESAGLKDVVWLQGPETVTVEAYYGPWDGLYMFHCHNLAHEDGGMMAAFDIPKLTDLGYAETDFYNPMDPLWQAKVLTADDKTEANIRKKVEDMANLKPYSNEVEVRKKLEEYWATHPAVAAKKRGLFGWW